MLTGNTIWLNLSLNQLYGEMLKYVEDREVWEKYIHVPDNLYNWKREKNQSWAIPWGNSLRGSAAFSTTVSSFYCCRVIELLVQPATPPLQRGQFICHSDYSWSPKHSSLVLGTVASALQEQLVHCLRWSCLKVFVIILKIFLGLWNFWTATIAECNTG